MIALDNASDGQLEGTHFHTAKGCVDVYVRITTELCETSIQWEQSCIHYKHAASGTLHSLFILQHS